MGSILGPKERSIDAAELAEAVRDLDAIVDGSERLIVTRDGETIAAVVSPEELRMVRRVRAEQRRRLEPILAIGRKFADVPTEELEREVAKAVSEARAELYAERMKAEAE